jgi:predicted metal-binding membrane protein
VNTLGEHRGLLGASAVVFVASAITTVLWCGSMASLPGMEMPGGWTMSMAWMRMPGQSWLGAAATFIGMWIVMMVAMMLPAFLPMLMRYRAAVGRIAGKRLTWLTTIASAGYFTVWTASGVVVFPLGLALAEIAMRVPAVSRAVPVATGALVMIAGGLQFTAWKKRQLACCRASPPRTLPADINTAWRHGLQLGFHCLRCCAGLTAVLLVIGVMELRAMTVVAALITAERLPPAGLSVARGVGILIVSSGVLMMAQGF